MTYGPTNPPIVPIGVDEGEPAGRRHPGEEARRDRPEDAARGVDAGQRDGQSRQADPENCARRSTTAKPIADTRHASGEVDDLPAAPDRRSPAQTIMPGGGDDVTAARDEADLAIRQVAQLDDLRQKEADAVRSDQEPELHAREDQHARRPSARRRDAGLPARAARRGCRSLTTSPLLFGQPASPVSGRSDEHVQHHQAEHGDRQSFEQEQPFPAGQAERRRPSAAAGPTPDRPTTDEIGTATMNHAIIRVR